MQERELYLFVLRGFMTGVAVVAGNTDYVRFVLADQLAEDSSRTWRRR